MATLTQEQIKEIADQLDCGFRCFWNRKSNELIFLPDPLKHPLMEMEVWAEEMEKVDTDFDDIKVIEPLDSREAFEIMIEFTETLADSNKLKGKLINALNKRKPFREFKFVIDNSGEYRQQWFDFKACKMQEWVKREIAFDEE